MHTTGIDKTSCLIPLAAFVVFLASPISQVQDSRYTLLASTALLHHGTLRLDAWAPGSCGDDDGSPLAEQQPYHFWCRDGHTYYFFPLGTPILALPYVALAEASGFPVLDEEGRYERKTEKHLQRLLAALVMALLAWLFYRTARLLLPKFPSVLVALGGSFGTQVWSTASRALWSHTFQLLLLGFVVWLLLRSEVTRSRPPSVLVASLLAWAYFVRPTSSIAILGCALYLLRDPGRLVLLLMTMALWMVPFVAASLHLYGSWLPPYYLASRLDFGVFWSALAGHLFSPARGLLIYVPLAPFVVLVAASVARYLRPRSLAAVAAFVVAAHLVVASAYSHWWGGHSYGPRLLTDGVPWLVLLGVLGLDAHRRIRADGTSPGSGTRRMFSLAVPVVGSVALALSVAVNGVGAVSLGAAKWNRKPIDVDRAPERLWDWGDPPFLRWIPGRAEVR